MDSNGKAVGWEYDAVAEIAKRLNAKITFQNSSWDAMIPAIAAGEYDFAMNGITIRDDRKDKVDFSDPYMRSEMVMLVRADEARFADAKGFAADPDLLMAAQPGTTPFMSASTKCSTAMRPTRASRNSRPSALALPRSEPGMWTLY